MILQYLRYKRDNELVSLPILFIRIACNRKRETIGATTRATNRVASTIAHAFKAMLIAVVVLSVLGWVSPALSQVRVLPGDIKDNRTTAGFFAGLEIELKVLGDILADAKAIRLSVASAADETGRDIFSEKESRTEFKELDESEQNAARLSIKLKNPARQAMTVREISGEVEVFVPRRDPSSTVTVNNVQKTTGSPIVSPALKSAGIEVTLWTKQQYEARRKAEEEKVKAQKAKTPADAGEAIGEALTKIFGGLMRSFEELGEHSVAIQIKDPQSKLVGIEFQDARGSRIGGGRMSFGGAEDQTRIYDFNEKLPDTARVRFYVLTAKAVVKAPFKLRDVPLP